MATLGELERAVMELLWTQIDTATAEDAAITANTLRDRLARSGNSADGKELAVTTVLTVLSRLEKKGLVRRERDIRPHRYRAVTSREEHTVELMHEVLGAAPDREAVLARFIGTVTEQEAETLRKLLAG
ncbi:BlaI/MecI/CopY family transcriptional regulator [Arthrobacter sp. I2-34]|uniref:BlaI/MecI/CopY family transcriptional regulator n=1 Tax=Arthrobacter hankyongi TaxID=2904801 RepID=A0ABS9LBY7_9MICC|nr:BlaI/MecI/CopY family transcriptional regulator [Arthrobacter hankyongi]MCG2624190.1 BlaI/MecI/CopY family transcriptional regulator [Arthrobacter hankyongi]